MLSNAISNHTIRGAMIITQNDQECWAILSYPAKPVNHILHAILTILLCGLWGIAWIILYVNRTKERRVRITVLPTLEVREEVMVLDN